MRELVAIGSQYPKALSQALADAGDDPASPPGQRLVRTTIFNDERRLTPR